MKRLEKLSANIVIVVMSVGCLIAIIGQIDSWPFSNYPMYSTIQDNSYSMMNLYGLVKEGAEIKEIPMNSVQFLSPFQHRWFTNSIVKIQSQSGIEKTRQAIQLILHQYQLRQLGHGDWPQFFGVRLYNEHYQLRPEVVIPHNSTAVYEQRFLVAEYSQP